MVYGLTSQDNQSIGKVFNLQVLKKDNSNASLFEDRFTSAGFDGYIPKQIQYIPVDDVKPGNYFISSSSATPDASSTINLRLIYSIEASTLSENPFNLGYTFYEMDNSGSISIINTTPISASSGSVWVYRDNWNSMIPGSSGWALTLDGNAIFSNVHVRGEINADTGTIGGDSPWYIGTGTITSGENASAIGLTTSTYSFYAGNETASLAPFYVTNTGNLYAQNANITGSISAAFGDIAGFTIDSYQLKKGVSKNLLSLYDPGFETNWSNYYTSFSNRTSPAPTGTVSDGKISSAALKKFGFGSGGLFVVLTGDPTADVGMTSNFFLPVTSNTQYTYSIYIYDPSTMIDALTASFYNSSSTIISSASQIISTTSSWARYSYTFTTPASTAFIKYGVFGSTGGFGTGGQITTYFDGAQIELGATATSWDIDSNIRVVSNAQNNEDPFRLYITENTSASTVLLALNPNGILQSRYIRINPFGDAGAISTTNYNHAFQIGTSSSQHIRMDNFGIQSILTSSYAYYDPSIGGYATAYSNTGSALYINKFGGDVIFGQSTLAYNSNLTVFGAASFSGNITASNSFITVNGTKVSLGGSVTVSAEGVPVFIQSSSPTTAATKYMWWDTSNGDLTLWIQDGV